MSFIANHFSEFLATYNPQKLGFIVSQSNVETYIRTEFAWYLEEKLNKDRGYEIFIELNRIDLQVKDISKSLVYIIEFGHHVNLHKLDILENFDIKYSSDYGKLNVKNRFDDNKVEFVQTITLKSNVKTAITGEVEFMVCDDRQCLPPDVAKFSVKL